MIRFKESQRFPFWVMLSLVLILSIAPLVLADVLYTQENAFERGIFLSLLMAALTTLFFSVLKLKTKVSGDSIRIRYFPFTWSYHTYSFEQIQSIRITKDAKIREYGGWNYSVEHKKAFTMFGKWAMEIQLASGDEILIGTQKPAELEAFLKDHVFPIQVHLNPEV
jgi:hypothetical protein